ncbi:MAG: extracellular solute-binding protein, partial [Chloroflexi bacterium]|nr:extracellular solute-binding protein [Chloroflexota bacterium]
MNKKRGWMATLALTFGLGLAFGMSRPVVSAPPVMTVVELWHAFNVEEEIALNQIIADFEAVNPTIDVQPVHHDWNLLNQQYAVSATLGLPAVLIGAADWGPQYYEAGLVRELNSLADKALLDSLDPVALDAIRYEAVLVGLPDSFKGVILYRNTQIIT